MVRHRRRTGARASVVPVLAMLTATCLAGPVGAGQADDAPEAVEGALEEPAAAPTLGGPGAAAPRAGGGGADPGSGAAVAGGSSAPATGAVSPGTTGADGAPADGPPADAAPADAAPADPAPADAAPADPAPADPAPADAAPADAAPADGEYASIPLYSDGLELGADGLPRTVPVGETAARPPFTQDLWLAAGELPGPARYAALAEQALRDLDALVLPDGAALAGLTEAWRYVWPRDASFAAAALAATGHPDDAYAILRHLQTLQREDGADPVLQARYLPDGTGAVPDDRGAQLDGSGWVLWAVASWYDEARASELAGRGGVRETDRMLARLRPLVVRSVAAIRANVGPDGLPTVFPDYWEVPEDQPTLGTAAALLLGLRAVGPVLDRLGEAPVDDVVAALDGAISAEFGPTFGRHPGEADRDTSVAFLMPPFATEVPEVSAAWAAAAESMGRPAGGLAPGAGWREDGVSWTPTTAMFALTAAASGERTQALAWLDWLEAHRTDLGALPEKVLWDGSPSAVAPLAWTCALVLLTLDALDHPAGTGPTPT